MQTRTNMPELLNRFMETSNISIQPLSTRIHRLVILRFVFSFGQCSDVATCIEKLVQAGVDIGQFNASTIEVGLFSAYGCEKMRTCMLFSMLTVVWRRPRVSDWTSAQPYHDANLRMGGIDQHAAHRELPTDGGRNARKMPGK